MEEDNQLGSATLRTRWWEPLKSGSATVVAVVVAVDEAAIKVLVVADTLQPLAELILALSQMRQILRSARGTLRRDSVSSVIRRDTDYFIALN
jgi:hypothetical protein